MTFSIPAPAPVVVDASVVVEALVGNPLAAEALERLAGDGRILLVPPILWPEVANALLKRHRVPAVEVGSALGYVEALGVETADRGPEGVRIATGIAEQRSLSVYDATYLWLAIDVDGELATLDAALARAAEAEGVPLALTA